MFLFAALAAGCGTSEAVGSMRPATTEVHAAPSEVLLPLSDGRLILEQEGRLVAIDPRDLDGDPIVVGPASELGEIHAAVWIDGAYLILASGGTFVLRDQAWVPSLLADSLDGPIRDAAALPNGDLWILTDATLYRALSDRVEPLALEASLEGAELAIVERPEGPALWVRLSDRVLEVWRDRTGTLRSASLVLPSAPEAIAGDAAGAGWLVIDGRLHSLGLDRRLVDHGIEAARLLGTNESDELWIFPPSGAPLLHADAAFFEAGELEVPSGARLAIAADGSLYVAGERVERHAPRHDVTFEGPASGSLLSEPSILEIHTPGEPAIEASVDGRAIEVRGQELTLVPSELGDGEHALVVRLSYDDGTLPIEERRTLEVVSEVTWTEHIEPIYAAHCADCHGPAGPANTRLDTREGWMSNAEALLRNVQMQRMPLNRPPLSQRQVALIELWMLSGFTE